MILNYRAGNMSNESNIKAMFLLLLLVLTNFRVMGLRKRNKEGHENKNGYSPAFLFWLSNLYQLTVSMDFIYWARCKCSWYRAYHDI